MSFVADFDPASPIEPSDANYGHDIELQETVRDVLRTSRAPEEATQQMLSMLDTLDQPASARKQRRSTTAELAADSLQDQDTAPDDEVRQLRFVAESAQISVTISDGGVSGQVSGDLAQDGPKRSAWRDIELVLPRGRGQKTSVDRSGTFLFAFAPKIFRLRLRCGLQTEWILHAC